ncbi:MAG: SprT-like domain-containing protein [Halanaerobiales bacterium]|nr:SprT-like domain-containing protein [Halanaerobiales bacterium]
MSRISLQEIIEKLESLFSKFNIKLFNNQLEKPVIAVSPNTNRDAYGWCTSWKAWKDGESEGYYEINISAEYLNRPFEEICETLIHEMVHLLNLQNKIKDTSRSGMYHNKRFKQIAEQHGLLVDKDTKYGWCITRLADGTLKYVKSLNEQGFKIYRSRAAKSKTSSSSSSKKYVCPQCRTIIRATKEVKVVCGNCDIEFKEEIK